MDYRELLKTYMFLIGELEETWYMNELGGLLAAGGVSQEEHDALIELARELTEELLEDEPEVITPQFLE